MTRKNKHQKNYTDRSDDDDNITHTNGATFATSMNRTLHDTMVNSMAECFALQQGIMNIPFYDGHNMPVKDFIEDILNAASSIPKNCEDQYLKSILAKLKGAARSSTQGANATLANSYGAPNAKIQMEPLNCCAMESFIKGLPDSMSTVIEARNPEKLKDAFEIALQCEQRHESYKPDYNAYHYSRHQPQDYRYRERSPSNRVQFSYPYDQTRYRSQSPTPTGILRNPYPPYMQNNHYPQPYPNQPNFHLPNAYMPYTSYPFYPYPPPQEGYLNKNQDGSRTPPRSQSPYSFEKSNLNSNTTRRTDATTSADPKERPANARILSFQTSSAILLIDTGADVNIIKENILLPELNIIQEEAIHIAGIVPIKILTLGTVQIEINTKPITFQVVSTDFPIESDGILGREYLREEKVEISFWHNTIVTHSNPIKPIFFADKESTEARDALTENKANKRRNITIKARTRQVIPIDVLDTELKEGYLPLIKTAEGLLVGEGVVTNHDGVCHIYAINMTSEDAEIEIPPQELIPFEFYKLPGEDSDGYSTEEEYTPPIDRVSAILEYLRLDHLNKDEEEHVTQIIKEFPDSFHLPGEQLTPTNMVQHKIITKDEIPIHVKQYRFSPTQKEEIDKVIDRMKSEGAIDSSCSPYNSPLLIIPKKIDGSGKKKWRIVIDFRALNEKTIGDCYPLPNITAILDTIGGAQYFSVFDLASGFHQIELDPNDRSKTAFSTTHGHYEYIRMPMGLKNSPSTFQRLMDQVLTGLQGVELFVYLDDIVVYANDLEEHGKKVRRLLQRLKGANLSLQPEKCEFLFKEVAYLGHIISSEGVKPNPKTVEAVKNFPTPKTPRNIKQFLGLAGYYRRFIKDFSAKAKPLSNLLKKDVKFEWKQEQEASFKELREALCTNPILQYPDYEKPFTLTTDASDFAIGAVLSQEKDGFDLPIAYLSRVLNAPELNYSTTEKECLAVLYAVHHFRPYIYGKKFTLVSDHEPLRWIATIKDPGQRLIRWRLKLRDYEYEFQHKSGKLNTNADALSRNVIEDEINENSQINVDQKQVKILINKRVDKIPKKPTKPSTTALSNPQKSKIQPPKSILKPSTLKSTLEQSTIGSRLAQRRAAQQSTLKSTLDQNTTDSKLTQRQALQPSTSKSNFNQSTIGSRVAQRRALQPRVKTIDEESIDSSTDEEREIPIPPIQKASRSLLPSLKLPPAAIKNIPGPKSAPPQIQPKVVNFPIPETTVITIEPPVSESEESSDEEEANAMNLSRKEIAKDLGNSISRFNEYVKQHEDWLIDSPQSPRNWLTLSDGNDDESIHKAANELIPGDHTEFSQKLDFQWDYAKGESMWEDKQINNSNNETFTKKVVNPEETIHLTPRKLTRI
ncbi:uncharacterized protein LOC122506001 [Leptopilina heterotoma]|uniref:uncharacterized protein LOC122506001 n=1 Tax=Leptopilina heterotoma TaxID=63436 RepID=UPI001CA85AF4|nr:uncharacterized protein LOC122506001 [Leptopilina heterotoma]